MTSEPVSRMPDPKYAGVADSDGITGLEDRPRRRDIADDLISIADASRRADGSDIPLGEQLRKAADALRTALAQLEEARAERDRAKAMIGEAVDGARAIAMEEISKLSAQLNAEMGKGLAAMCARAEAAEARLEELTRERDEAKAAWKDAEARAKEANRGLEYLNDIDDAWDAFGTAGNRMVLTLAEQISSQGRELETAEARLEEAKAVLAFYAAKENWWNDETSVNKQELFDVPMGDDLGDKARAFLHQGGSK